MFLNMFANRDFYRIFADNSNPTMQKRDNSFDLIRVVACFMVVLNHSPIPTDGAHGPFLTALSYFRAPCIGLFMMLSGALLLPVKTDYVTFVRRRVGKILIPTLLWTAVYLAIKSLVFHVRYDWVRTILSLPLSTQGTGVLWFMYTLTGLYLLAPILSAWLERARRRDIEIVLGLWGVTLCYPYLSLWLSVDTSHEGILYYFSGYIGYFILGYYLRRYPSPALAWPALAVGLGGAALLGYCRTHGIEADFYTMFWHLSIFVAALTVAYWIGLRRLWGSRECDWFRRIGRLTFGVYFTHIIIMRYWLWHIPFIRAIDCYPLQTLVIGVVTFLLSLALTWGLSRLPFGQYLVGVSSRKEKR